MGAFIGLIITGAAFVLPRIISQAIIEPAGGVSIVTEGQVACDSLLEDQLVAQRGANSAARMNEVIRLIQNRQECSADIWNPSVLTTVAFVDVTEATGNYCYKATATDIDGGDPAAVGTVAVPLGLRVGRENGKSPVERAFRDESNNIVVYFSGPPLRQLNLLAVHCSLRSWSRNYQ